MRTLRTATDGRRPYADRRWRKVARMVLSAHPLCALCLRVGRQTAATVVDHIVPHRGDRVLFWSVDNLQALCFDCHNSAKAHQERDGFSPGCGVDGVPVDSEHPWNRRRRAG